MAWCRMAGRGTVLTAKGPTCPYGWEWTSCDGQGTNQLCRLGMEGYGKKRGLMGKSEPGSPLRPLGSCPRGPRNGIAFRVKLFAR